MKARLALLFTVISVAAHIYLTVHHYDLNLGLSSGESFCNINSAFNCDVISASSYSELLGMPIALWGAVTNGILALLILMGILDWVDNQARHKRYTLWLSAYVAAISLVMGFISTTQIGTYCIFCIATYVLSFATFITLRLDLGQTEDSLTGAFKKLFTTEKKYLGYLVSIPIIVLFAHKVYMMNHGPGNFANIINASISEWKTSPTTDFTSVAPALVKGSTTPKMIISEFADFRCSHCKHAVATLKAFYGSRKDVQVQFYSFPLDGTCNEAMKSGGDGISCLLAKSVYCAEKTSQKGWELHDHVFSIQEKINMLSSFEAVKDLLNVAYKNFNINEETQNTCVNDMETEKAIRAQAKLGETSGISGTPAIFVNGRKLNRGQVLPVLEKAYQSL